MRFERVTSIGLNHPSLAGHFPGHPVVPGVVLLQEVLSVVSHNVSAELVVTGLPMVKFASPLKPDELVTIEVDQEKNGLITFSCRVDQRLIASGIIECVSRAAQVEGA